MDWLLILSFKLVVLRDQQVVCTPFLVKHILISIKSSRKELNHFLVSISKKEKIAQTAAGVWFERGPFTAKF